MVSKRLRPWHCRLPVSVGSLCTCCGSIVTWCLRKSGKKFAEKISLEVSDTMVFKYKKEGFKMNLKFVVNLVC
jgi:hypothetical protein